MSVCFKRIIGYTFRTYCNKSFITSYSVEVSPVKYLLSRNKNDIFQLGRQFSIRSYSSDAIQPPLALDNASITLKKKTLHKKAVLEDLTKKEGHFLTFAYATANSYDLKGLKEALVHQKLYEPGK